MSGPGGGGLGAATLAAGLAEVFAAELEQQAGAAAAAWPAAAAAATRAEACRTLTRIFHTIKGGAGLAGRTALAESAARLEHCFADPSGAAAPAQADIDVLFDAAGISPPQLATLLAGGDTGAAALGAAAEMQLVPCAIGPHWLAVPMAALARAAFIETACDGAAAAFGGLARETIWLHDLLALPRPSGRAAALLLCDGAAVVVDRVQPPQTCSVESLAPASWRQPSGRQPSWREPWVVGIAVDDTGRAWHVLDPQQLPFTRAVAAPPAAATVLVVDDSLVAREAAAAALRGARVSFDVATDGRDALAKLRLGAYAVVLSDLEMPHLDGFGLIAQMRASRHLADQPVVVCSSRLDAATRDRLQPLRVAGFLPKPFAAGDLLDTLRPWLASLDGLAR